MDTSFQGAYKVFYGASDIIGNIRALQSIYENAGNTFNLVSGTTDRNFHIFLPPNKILESVLSVEASNANITPQYIYQGFVNVNDAGGNNTSYKHYKMTTDKPYDENNTHRITIKNG